MALKTPVMEWAICNCLTSDAFRINFLNKHVFNLLKCIIPVESYKSDWDFNCYLKIIVFLPSGFDISGKLQRAQIHLQSPRTGAWKPTATQRDRIFPPCVCSRLTSSYCHPVFSHSLPSIVTICWRNPPRGWRRTRWRTSWPASSQCSST